MLCYLAKNLFFLLSENEKKESKKNRFFFTLNTHESKFIKKRKILKDILEFTTHFCGAVVGRIRRV